MERQPQQIASPAPGMPATPTGTSVRRAKQVAEAVAREMAKAHTHYQALLNERGTAVFPPALR